MYDKSNGCADGPTGLTADNMDVFDALPAELRQIIANSIMPWNSIALAEVLSWGGLQSAIAAVRNTEKIQHDAAVKAKVMPKVRRYRFELHRRSDESPIETARRAREELKAFRYRFRHRPRADRE